MQHKIRNYWSRYSFYLILVIISVYYFIFLGEPGCAYTNDSLGYLEIGFERFPVYTMLFQLFLKLFGAGHYQLYVIYFQGLLAVFCVMLLLIFLTRQFSLSHLESVLVYLALIMPYGIDTLWNEPRYVYTHFIATEGVTYSLYYLFFACLLHFLLNKRQSALLWALLLIPVMCCTRSQLMICYPIVIVGIVYIYWRNIKKLLFSVLFFLCSILTITLVNNGYHWYYQGDFEPSSVNEFTLFANLIFVSDKEDIQLIEDEISAGLFRDIFEQSYVKNYNYDFAPAGFTGLSDTLVNSHDKIKFDILYPAMKDYTASLGLDSKWEEDRVQRDMLKSMSRVLRKDNFSKWLHTCVSLIPRALMLSFNPVTPPQILGLCYAYALFMSLLIALYILYRLIRFRQFAPPLLSLCAVYILLMTNAVGLSISLYGLSRYTNYNLGLIYIVIFLCMRQYFPSKNTRQRLT